MTEPTFSDALRALAARVDLAHDQVTATSATYRRASHDPTERGLARNAWLRAMARRDEAQAALGAVMRLQGDALAASARAELDARYASDDARA